MSQIQMSAMQKLVNKLNQMGNGVGVTAGMATNNQTTWTELMDALNGVINEQQAIINETRAELQRLQAENAKLRAVAESAKEPQIAA